MQPKPEPAQDTNLFMNVDSPRKLDLVFLIDNSASMLPKQEKLQREFPKLIDALKSENRDPPLPDLRIAIVNSDLGTGASGRCAKRYGDRGVFQVPGAAECGVKPGATFLEYENGKNLNFAADKDLSEVFGCLAVNIGQRGCGFEQPLQALNWAFNLEGNIQTQGNGGFIRDDALLGIVILTDEDDCSMEPNSLLADEDKFSSIENWNVRCATRGHQCEENNLAYPTAAGFDMDFAKCKARRDFCDPTIETGKDPSACSPLADIQKIATGIKSVKKHDPEKLFIAGIFGWPRAGQSIATYKIEKVPQKTSGQPDLYDYWPVCFDPHHPLPATGTADRANFDLAFGWGGFGGLRIKAFLDEFPPDKTLAFSICEPDFSQSMQLIGEAIRIALGTLCINQKLLDTDLTTQGVQADCRVVQRIPTSKDGPIRLEESTAMPRCDQSNGQRPCWKVTRSELKCPIKRNSFGNILVPSQLIEVDRKNTLPPPPNTKVGIKCRTCPEMTLQMEALYQVEGCLY
jgi:hypothetical protein